MLSDSSVQEGHASAVVTATGARSRAGQSAHLIVSGDDDLSSACSPNPSCHSRSFHHVRQRWHRAYGRRARALGSVVRIRPCSNNEVARFARIAFWWLDDPPRRGPLVGLGMATIS